MQVQLHLQSAVNKHHNEKYLNILMPDLKITEGSEDI